MIYTDRVFLTEEGRARLEQELTRMREERRPELLERLRAATGGSDWRDDVEHTRIRDELGRLDAEIDRLEDLLAAAEIAQPHRGDAAVEVGETVTLEADGETERYTIVGPTEAEPERGRISYECPLGAAVLGQKIGDLIEVSVPDGVLRYRIIAIE